MSWTSESGKAGFTSGEPFRALSANYRDNNAAHQMHDPKSLWSFYRDVIGLRHKHAALRVGHYGHVQHDGWMMSFQRSTPRERMVGVFNYHDEPARWILNDLPAGAEIRRIWPAYQEDLKASDKGTLPLMVPGTSFAVFEVVQP